MLTCFLLYPPSLSSLISAFHASLSIFIPFLLPHSSSPAVFLYHTLSPVLPLSLPLPHFLRTHIFLFRQSRKRTLITKAAQCMYIDPLLSSQTPPILRSPPLANTTHSLLVFFLSSTCTNGPEGVILVPPFGLEQGLRGVWRRKVCFGHFITSG